jgi:hypothetical protein
MVCWHKRHILGDEQPKADPIDWAARTFHLSDRRVDKVCKESQSRNPIEDAITLIGSQAIVLPLYLYDHSGITISTKPFPCRWDSGMVGLAYATRKRVRETWKRWTTKKVEERINAEVVEYDHYISGDVFIITVHDKEGDEIGGYHHWSGYRGVEEEARMVLASFLRARSLTSL